MSIRLKLTIMFLAIAVIPLAMVSLLTFNNYKDSLEASHIAQLQNLASFKAESIETYFDRLKADIEMTYDFYNIRRNLPILNRFADKPDSNEFIAAKKMLDGQLLPMQEVLELFDIMLVNPEGKVVYASNPKHFASNLFKPLPDPEQKAFEEGKKGIYFSSVFSNLFEANELSILITAPAYDANDTACGIIAFEVNIASIYDIIQDLTGLGHSGEVLLGRKIGGEVLLGRKIGGEVTFLNPLKYDPRAITERRLRIGDVLGGPIQEAIAGRSGGGILADYRGEKVIAAWRYLPSLDWGMVAKIDAKEAFADATNLRNLATVIMAVVFGLSAVMAFSIAQSISEPIKRLSDGANIIGHGNLDYKVGTAFKDEIGQLSRTFDKMTGDLKQTTASRDELNREIVERKQAEEKLRESEQFIKSIAEASPHWFYVFDLEIMGITYTNRPILRDLGYPPEMQTVTGLDTFRKFMPPAEMPHLERLLEEWRTLADGRVRDDEYCLRHADGTLRYFAGREIVFTRHPDGTVRQVLGLLLDITDRKQAEEKLRQSEQRVRAKLESVLSPEGDIGTLALSDIIDAEAIQALMENFHKLIKIPMAIIDLEGNVAVGVGWQDICTKFHRMHPTTCKYCIESDTMLTTGIAPGEFRLYKCKNNLWDVATPIIIAGKHVGNLFIGQFFFEDDQLDYELFRRQAKEYGFDEKEYIASLERVPRLSREAVNTAMVYFLELAEMVSQLSYSNIKLARILTERDRLTKSLEEKQDDLNRAQAVANIGSWRLNVRKNELLWSEENHRIFGVPKGTPMTYETFLSAIHPDDRQYVDAKWQAALKGEPYDIEHRIVVEGKIKWVREKAYLDLDESGVLLGGFGITQDITKHKADEEALRQSEARHRSIVTTALDGFWQVDTQGRFIDVNDAACRMLGYTRDEMLTMKIADIEVIERPEDVKAHIEKITAAGADRFESKHKRKDGQVIDVEISTCVIKDAQGVRLFVFIREITQRKRTEEALKRAKEELEVRVKERTAELAQTVDTLKQEVLDRIAAEEAVRKSEGRYRSLTVATTQVVWTTDAQGQVVGDMPSWREFTGQSIDEMQGWGWINSLHPDDRERTAAIWSNAVSTRSLYETEYRLRRSDGEYRYVSVRGVPVVEPDGAIREWIGTCTDITEKRAAETELEKYRLHLEELVKQRTEDLARSNRDLEQFAYAASHDLQEPLRAVAGFVHLLKHDMKDSLDGKKLEYMNFVVDGVVRMQALINGLLEYSRIGSRGKEPQQTDTKEALENAIANLHVSIKESGAKVTAGDLPNVLFDAGQLSRLFQNLISNAIKFRGDQPPRIHISAERQDDAWRFAIRDNGIGIEPQYAERIFLLFQRLHGRDKYPGTGIGLAICKRIVERHGGKIWVEQNPDAGSTFYFTVPEKSVVS